MYQIEFSVIVQIVNGHPDVEFHTLLLRLKQDYSNDDVQVVLIDSLVVFEQCHLAQVRLDLVGSPSIDGTRVHPQLIQSTMVVDPVWT